MITFTSGVTSTCLPGKPGGPGSPLLPSLPCERAKTLKVATSIFSQRFFFKFQHHLHFHQCLPCPPGIERKVKMCNQYSFINVLVGCNTFQGPFCHHLLLVPFLPVKEKYMSIVYRKIAKMPK